ncbi:MAG: alkaline phosphatase family protein [Acidobacteriota bacterium]|jgi:predicted AlkP superfamily phosphohydrolase/phosphomutase|nr:alkaline phosphatase family protein [Acidobacteriota bacterium]OQB57729.1 MAG: Type I phosphodiesterase / nucleotide pyrophosphatase [Candidatus Aminicenantes bacterium ADurb.Bin147]HNT31004.1 alkaline phosphatase family protein [Candidatus Aminicenantes bacterium]MDD8033584.1 alkaline phosphatase family protein [Acidobacteriota bacterium]MDD8037883.1 alkaline phosphatase family protein [Acidobacteriota bacterium]
MRKALIIGLDSAPAEIVFDRRKEFPNLNRLLENGSYGTMRSSDPPITIPAWMVMSTGKDAGRLGLYGFRHRTGPAYDKMWIATAQSINEPAIWDIIGQAGGQSVLVSVPPSYPPRPLAGNRIGCFITPGADKDYTYPKELKAEIEEKFGPYLFDVPFRIENRAEILKEIYRMTEKRFEVIQYLMRAKPWNLFMFVEIGVDRVQHAFWKFFDKTHHLYEAGNEFEAVIVDYYKFVDEKIGALLKEAGDDTVVLAVSDHGAKRMKGAFCINEWLIAEGDLVLGAVPARGASIEKTPIDWAKTKAWGWGGYYARVFLNVEGREPQGIIKPADYEKEREALAERLRGIRGPNGEKWATQVIKPNEYYDDARGDYPDLMVYFDDLYWRSAGTLGWGTMYLAENDTGPDDAVHAQHGMYIFYDPQAKVSARKDIDITDIAPTVLKALGLPVPADMKGRSLR